MSHEASGNYQYNLDPEESRYHIDRFLSKELPASHRDRYIAAVFEADEPIANAGRTLEQEVFGDTFGNDLDLMSREYGPYEQDSRFVLVVDKEPHQMVGVLRYIMARPQGLKSFNDALPQIHKTAQQVLNYHQIDPLELCVDVVTLAVKSAHRGNNADVSTLLYRALYRQGERDGINHLFAIIDKCAFAAVRGTGIDFGPMAGVAEPFEYLGSQESYALCGPFANLQRGPLAKMQSLEGATGARAKLLHTVARRIATTAVDSSILLLPSMS